MKYELYGTMHRIAKRILHRSTVTNSYHMVNVPDDIETLEKLSKDEMRNSINDIALITETLKMSDVFPVENIVSTGTFLLCCDSFRNVRKCKNSQLGVEENQSYDLWMKFVEGSRIPDGYRNSGLHYAGYILDCEEWCLPSWIWTNAALAKMYCHQGLLNEAKVIVDKLIGLQQESGGWIVRNDYDHDGAVPVLAPNDSAYIANNACLEFYLLTGDKKYLNIAQKCADWIIKTARDDGMVYVGYDMKRNYWQKKHNIVDVGFTAGFFARLFECTKEEKYYIFLKKFTNKFIELFYIPTSKGFATSLDENDHQQGGMFGRGQAWALEGLIPASRVLMNDRVTEVVQDTINNLLRVQDRCGGWAYNISKPLMGIDCKAVSIIACSLMNWYSDHTDQEELKAAAQKAFQWCLKHTLSDGRGKGGIYSYTTEGAIVHHMYTWTGFVYGSSYAIELQKMLASR